MIKGTILSINKQWASVFTEDCRLVKMPVRPAMMIGQEISLPDPDAEKAANANRPARPLVRRSFRYALSAASLVVLLAVGLLFGRGLLTNPVYATIAIDVNPSLELALNQDLKVTAARALNNDAATLLSGQDLTGLDWQVAVARWTVILQNSKQVQVQNMLIAAVMPENAEALQTQLLALEGKAAAGDLSGIQVRVIYSFDQTIPAAAKRNGLSVGRQMLLNQAVVQNKNWDKSSIADAPLGDLIQELLRAGEQNQTRLTERTTRPGDETGAGSTASGATETHRETHQQTNQQTHDGTGITGSGQTWQSHEQQTSQQNQSGTTGPGTGSPAGPGTSGSQMTAQSSQTSAAQTSTQHQTSTLNQPSGSAEPTSQPRSSGGR